VKHDGCETPDEQFLHEPGNDSRNRKRCSRLFLTLLLPAACHPCTWPERVEWEAPRLNARAFREGVEDQLPVRRQPYEWESLFLDYPRRWALAAGLHDLSRVLLPKGVVEVRIWEEFNPHTRYQGTIVQKRNSSFYGADLFFGAVEPDSCGGWAVGLVPCDSWESVWSELLSQGLMELPDSSELPDGHFLEDGIGLVVEIQAEGQYRTYHYDDPDYQTWTEARRVEKIIDVVRHRILCEQHRPGST